MSHIAPFILQRAAPGIALGVNFALCTLWTLAGAMQAHPRSLLRCAHCSRVCKSTLSRFRVGANAALTLNLAAAVRFIAVLCAGIQCAFIRADAPANVTKSRRRWHLATRFAGGRECRSRTRLCNFPCGATHTRTLPTTIVLLRPQTDLFGDSWLDMDAVNISNSPHAVQLVQDSIITVFGVFERHCRALNTRGEMRSGVARVQSRLGIHQHDWLFPRQGRQEIIDV
mmetsp:Transcript_5141/g.13812  ORF Transcript_5141/g.13812 Transcript_5141/m.13812 type:complete len:227 (-) Transcript_5141:764-1444(-)